MSEEQFMEALRQAGARATSALEQALQGTRDTAALRAEFEKAMHRLPEDLRDMGFLQLDSAQSKTLVSFISQAMAREILRKAEDQNSRWWDRRLAPWGVLIVSLGVFADLAFSIYHVVHP